MTNGSLIRHMPSSSSKGETCTVRLMINDNHCPSSSHQDSVFYSVQIGKIYLKYVMMSNTKQQS